MATGGVAPTLNAFDNGTESRATVVIPLDLRNALRDPDKHDEVNRQGVGVGEEGDPAPTVTSAAVHGVVAFSHTQGLDAQPSEQATPTLRANGGGQAVAYGYDEYNDLIREEVHHTLRAGTRQSTGVVAPTLSATNNPSRLPQSSEVTAQVEAMVNATSTVRRLTPMECERLQGFPDNWTAERFDEAKATVVKQADSARYKQMGNAVAVPVFEWVIKRLVDYEKQT